MEDCVGGLEVHMDLTVNEAEYNGLLLCFELLADLEEKRVIICGDKNQVIRQMRGDIDCKAPGLQLLRQWVDCECGPITSFYI